MMLSLYPTALIPMMIIPHPGQKMDKVNQVLKLFGQELGPQPIHRNKLIRE
jgi:hypothetical protein